jgi:hypothetical protein
MCGKLDLGRDEFPFSHFPTELRVWCIPAVPVGEAEV